MQTPRCGLVGASVECRKSVGVWERACALFYADGWCESYKVPLFTRLQCKVYTGSPHCALAPNLAIHVHPT